MIHPLNDQFHDELHGVSHAHKLNWLRASVLGANDGIVSVAALVVGVAGATQESSALLLTGVAGLLSGALSMAVGEYVSVSTQRDTEEALLQKERFELEHYPDAELKELSDIYEAKGMSPETALQVAKELTAHDAFAAHVEAELHINPEELTNPWVAAIASGASFTAGAIIPIASIMLSPAGTRIPITFAAVLVALGVTGYLSAKTGDAPVVPATVRVIVGGIVAMAITFGIGSLFGVAGA